MGHALSVLAACRTLSGCPHDMSALPPAVPWARICMRALTGLRGARRAQGKERNRDLLNIEVVAALNQAHCRLHHLRNCLPSEELARECGRARPRPPCGLPGCQPGPSSPQKK